jgi:hypothetical protein
LHEITPEQAAELFLVSKPGFSPLSESALIDAREMPFLTVKLEWYRGVNAFASIMGARAFVLFLRFRKILILKSIKRLINLFIARSALDFA